MLKLILTGIVCFFFLCSLMAQHDSAYARHIIYAEGGGIGGYGSVNYEYVVINKGLFKLTARAGLGAYRFVDFQNKFNPNVILPLAVYGLFGKTHFAEVGVGQAISSIVLVNTENLQPQRTTAIHANFSIGYRFQRDKGGLFLRLCYSPLIEHYKTFRHWGGVSIGYVFKPKNK